MLLKYPADLKNTFFIDRAKQSWSTGSVNYDNELLGKGYLKFDGENVPNWWLENRHLSLRTTEKAPKPAPFICH